MSQINERENVAKCYCSIEAATVTSWKNANVGRRFLGCAKYPHSGYCRFFQRIEPLMCDRAKEVIPSLLKKINDQRIEIVNAEEMEEKYQAMCSGLKGYIEELENEIIALKFEEEKKLINENKK
ncbi:hypothetical protein ACS0TY_017327 [Phlomoides rotata]